MIIYCYCVLSYYGVLASEVTGVSLHVSTIAAKLHRGEGLQLFAVTSNGLLLRVSDHLDGELLAIFPLCRLSKGSR